MAYNIGDQMVVEATITPDSSTPSATPAVVTCTFTDPLGVADTPISMSNVSGTLWRCTGPTFDLSGGWRYKVNASSGLVASETGRIQVDI